MKEPIDVIALSALLEVHSVKRKYRYAVLRVMLPPGWAGDADFDTRTGGRRVHAHNHHDERGNLELRVRMRQPLKEKA